MLLIPALVCLAGGLAVPLFRSRAGRSRFVLLVTLLASALLAALVLRGDTPGRTLLRITPLFAVGFRVDAVNRVFLLLIAFLWPLSSLYAFEYMAHEEREPRFFAFYTLAYGFTQLLALADGLFTLYLFYECLTLITLPLVTHREDGESLRAGLNYLTYTVGGAALGLIALVVLAVSGASGSFVPGGSLPAEALPGREDFLRGVFLLAFIGFGSKAALFPLSFWLPRASVAPTPVTALLHAVAVVNAGAFACLRLTFDCFGASLLAGSWAQAAAVLLAAGTILLGAVMAVRERHLKRRLAWSTVYNLSYMLFSVALLTPAGLRAALCQLVLHGLMKISLFFCAGAFQVRLGAEYLPDLRGLGRSMPRTVACFVLAALSLTGIPPLAGFLSKWNILSAALQVGTWAAWTGAGAVILSSVLACVYLLEPAVQMIFQHPSSPAPRSDPSWRMMVPLALLALSVILPGFWPEPLRSLLDAAAALY